MKDLKKFHKRLIKESSKKEYTIKEAINKDLQREDALALISEFVKDVKKKFDKKDVLEILRDTSKTLDFFINEIENTSTTNIMSVASPSTALSFDDISTSSDSEESRNRPFSGDDEGGIE